MVSAGSGCVVTATCPASPPLSPTSGMVLAVAVMPMVVVVVVVVEIVAVAVAVAVVVAVAMGVVCVACAVLVTMVASVAAVVVCVVVDVTVVRQAIGPSRRSNSCQCLLGRMVPGAGRALLRMHRRMRAIQSATKHS